MTTERIHPTDAQLDTFVRAYRAEHPDALPDDVLEAARAQGWFLQVFQLFGAFEKVRPVATLTIVTAAIEFMTELRRRYDDVGVFVAGGWDGPNADITIIVDGDGQLPFARLAAGTYRTLLDDGYLGENTYGGFKARRFHDFMSTVIV